MSRRRKPQPPQSKRSIPTRLRERTRLAAVLVTLVVVLTTAAALGNRWETWGRVEDYPEALVLRAYQARVAETEADILTIGGVLFFAALFWLFVNASAIVCCPPKGVCPACASDLTGSTGGRCPGCGRKLRGHLRYCTGAAQTVGRA